MQDLMANVTLNVLKIMFKKNGTTARNTATDFVNGILENDLRSPKLATEALKISRDYGQDSQRRILTYKLAAMCGDEYGRKEWTRILLMRKDQISRDIRRIPDTRFEEWGRGRNMGKFVAKARGML